MREAIGTEKVQIHRSVLCLMAVVILQCLCASTSEGADGEALVVDLPDKQVTPGHFHTITLPAVDGSEPATFNVTITTDTNEWRIVYLYPPNGTGWSGLNPYMYAYAGTSPGEAYDTGIFSGKLERVRSPILMGGGGGEEPEYTFTVTTEGDSIEPEFYILPPQHTVCVGQSATFTAYKRPGAPEVSNWTLDGVPRPDAADAKSFETDAPGTYTVDAETNGLSDTARLTFFEAVLVMPEGVVADNFPVNEISLSVDPEVALGELTIASISNTPTDPNPRNALGTTDMVFTEIEHGKWKIEKAIWYGSTANPVAYGRWTDTSRGTEYRAPHDITVTLILSNGHECQITGVLLVELTDGDPSVNFLIEWNSNIKWSVVIGYYIDMTDVLFYKSHAEIKFDEAVSQYRDMILREENAHINQWYGVDHAGIGWEPADYHHHGDVLTHPAWEQAYINSAVAEGGEYDSVRRRITFSGFTSLSRGEVRRIEENARAKVDVEQWPPLSKKRRPLAEKEAKAFAGFKEAYGYEHTYMLPPDEFPANPEWVEWP